MSDTELTQEGVEEGALLPPMPVPEITYRGSQNYIRFETPFRTIYEFSSANKFTVQPETWGDFYSIITIDGTSISRNFVLTMDPSSKESFRRVSAMEREEESIPQEIFDKQKEVDFNSARKTRIEAFKNEYQRNINLQIINGTLDHIPENLEADAEKYADEKIKEEDENRAKESSEVDETEVLENISTEIVDPVTEPIVETEGQPEVTQTVGLIEETPVVTPTEPVAPTEVPLETTNPEAPVAPIEEAPTTDPVVENPEVEKTEEPSVLPVESTVEAPIEEEVTATSKKKKSA